MARRIRESSVYCEIHQGTLRSERSRARPSAIILSGRPPSVYGRRQRPRRATRPCSASAAGVLRHWYDGRAKLMHTTSLGGKVRALDERDTGPAGSSPRKNLGISGSFKAGEKLTSWITTRPLTSLPPGFRAIGKSGQRAARLPSPIRRRRL